MKDNNNYVARALCYYCGQIASILIDKRLRDISEIDNKVVDMTPCQECQKLMEQGVMLIAISKRLSEPGWNKPDGSEHWMPNPYRTGQIVVVKDDAITRILDKDMADYALLHRWMFIPDDILSSIIPQE